MIVDPGCPRLEFHIVGDIAARIVELASLWTGYKSPWLLHPVRMVPVYKKTTRIKFNWHVIIMSKLSKKYEDFWQLIENIEYDLFYKGKMG